MSTVDGATFKSKADELLAKAFEGDITLIDHNGKRAVLMPYSGAEPDFQLYPEVDNLLQQRVKSQGREPTDSDWQALAQSIGQQ